MLLIVGITCIAVHRHFDRFDRAWGRRRMLRFALLAICEHGQGKNPESDCGKNEYGALQNGHRILSKIEISSVMPEPAKTFRGCHWPSTRLQLRLATQTVGSLSRCRSNRWHCQQSFGRPWNRLKRPSA